MKAIILGWLMLSLTTYASDIELDNLSQQDVDDISEEFSANFVHSTVSGASTMGSIFGFEVGIVGRVSDASKIGALVKEQDANSDVSSLYDAGLMAQVSIPFGITAEMVYLPEWTQCESYKFRSEMDDHRWSSCSSF